MNRRDREQRKKAKRQARRIGIHKPMSLVPVGHKAPFAGFHCYATRGDGQAGLDVKIAKGGIISRIDDKTFECTLQTNVVENLQVQIASEPSGQQVMTTHVTPKPEPGQSPGQVALRFVFAEAPSWFTIALSRGAAGALVAGGAGMGGVERGVVGPTGPQEENLR